MKKLYLTIIGIIAAAALLIAPSVYVAQAESVNSDLVFPQDFVQLYDIESPTNVHKYGNEYVFSNEKIIAYYDGENYHTFNLPEHSISKSLKVGDYILFLSVSKIYALNPATGEIRNTDVETSTDLDVFGNTLITNPSNSLSFYTITDSQSSFSTTLNKTYNLGFTPNAVTLCNEETLYFENEGNIYYFNNGASIVASNVLNVRDADFENDFLYVSTSDGIFRLSKQTLELTRILVCDKVNELKHLNSPFGISIDGENLYIADSQLNAITCYNTVNGCFSDFAITTSRSDEHRISDSPCDVVCEGSKTYILDGDYIKTYEHGTNLFSSIKLEGYFGAKIMAVSGNTVLLSSYADVKLASIKGDGLEPITVSADFSKFMNVTAVDSLDKDFYILNNEIVQSVQKAVVYKLDTETYTLEKTAEIVGRGENMTVDLFGEIYVNVYNGVNYDLHRINKHNEDEIFYNSNHSFLSLYCDYDGNVFYLNGEGDVVTVKQNKETCVYSIEKSQNVNQSLLPLKMDFSWEDDTCYVLYKNLVLSVSGESLKVSTPKKITVPDAFEITLNLNPQFLTVERGSKLIEISLEQIPSSEYFTYKNVLTQTDDSAYVSLYSNDRYAIVANEDIVAIVRAEDVSAYNAYVNEAASFKYFVSDSNVYALPLIQGYAKTGQLPSNARVEVKKTYMFNGRSYALCENQSVVGFVATSMLKEGIAGELNPHTYTVLKLKSNADYYVDSNLLEKVGELYSGNYVCVVESLNGISKIYIDGEYYYIDSKCIEYNSATAIRNTVVIGCMFVALFITTAYFAIVWFRKKQLK